MRITRDDEVDVAGIYLVDAIGPGEIVRDVGPALTPSGGSVTMGYDAAGFLLQIEVLQYAQALAPEATGETIQVVPTGPDTVEIRLVPWNAPDTYAQIGRQLTPSGDTITALYDGSERLVGFEIDGASRVLRS